MSNKRNYNLEFKLDDSSSSGTIDWKFQKYEGDNSDKSLGYYMIMGRDLMYDLGLIVKCKGMLLKWKKLKIQMAASSTNLKSRYIQIPALRVLIHHTVLNLNNTG